MPIPNERHCGAQQEGYVEITLASVRKLLVWWGGSILKAWKNHCLSKPFTAYIQSFDGTTFCLQPCFPANDIKACLAKEHSVLAASIDQRILMRPTSISEAWKQRGQLDNACTRVTHKN